LPVTLRSGSAPYPPEPVVVVVVDSNQGQLTNARPEHVIVKLYAGLKMNSSKDAEKKTKRKHGTHEIEFHTCNAQLS